VSISTFYRWIDQHNRRIRTLAIPLLLAYMFGVYFIVMNTGGIKYVFSHSMYLAIILSAIIYGALGGVAAAIIGGVLLGPFVPIDTITGETQITINWVYRLAFFALIGTTIGLASDGMRSYIKHLRWSVRHDGASFLPNRFALEADIKALSLRTDKSEEKFPYCLTMISMANSKEIETSFGMVALDHIMMQMSSRIKKQTLAETVVYRTSIDQLCLLIVESKQLEIKAFCKSLRKFFQEPFRFNTLQLHGDIQIGVVKFDEILHSPSYYIQKASAAALQAEIANAPEVIELNQSSDFAIIENIELLGRLKEALESKQLQLHYQPKINLHTGSIAHVEALMRWNHPTLGAIPPGKFIPRAERSTLIDRLTEFAIDEALRQIVRWKKAGIAMKVAVNISAQNLTQPSFVYQVMNQLEKYGVDGSSLELELTENSLMHNVNNAIEVLTKLTKLGIVVSIDDFGTGYSSLQYLQKLPVSIIKIDQSFILNLATDDGARYIVDAAVNLAHKIDMKVVAEGVEDQQALNILKEMGCDYAQGFLISRPVPASEFTKWRAQLGGIYR
jgi:EAL domain-containing protein (putative c-di-GMP-specific phosphodiesterase class I)/GGDEF domain-containing protein